MATAVQMKAGPDKGANLAKAAEMVTEAARAGAELVVLPEVFNWRGRQREEVENAEPVPGPSTEAMARLARDLGIHLVAGSVLERSGDAAGDQEESGNPEKCFNTCVLFDPQGEQLAAYRKIHLFDIDLPGRVTIRESDTRRGGSEPVCVETELGRIGLAVCYDLRFPELFRRLGEAGAEIIVLPSSFTAPTGSAHWEPLIRARAIENQCYMIASNQFGASKHGFADYGHSLIADPWGEVLAEGSADKDENVSAALQGERLARVREELPCLTHRRL